MKARRRAIGKALAAVAITPCALALRMTMAANAAARVLVIGPSTSSAYQEAVSGILERMQSGNVDTVTVDSRGARAPADLAEALRTKPRLIVAVGSEAIDWLSKERVQAPVLTTMTLRPPYGVVCAVLLGVPIGGVLSRLRVLFPGKTKVGVLYNPAAETDDRAALRAECARQGFSLEIQECASPAEVVSSFLRLRDRKVDFVICLPDASLYNAATIKPLILASLEYRVPVVGFSASFVRAGAAVGVYADLRALGRQTAEAAMRYLAAQPPPATELPRTIQVAVNQRVIRLIGLDFDGRDSADVVVFK
jgi:putative tryptophan/tyrosine transport system substrate-binding protein